MENKRERERNVFFFFTEVHVLIESSRKLFQSGFLSKSAWIFTLNSFEKKNSWLIFLKIETRNRFWKKKEKIDLLRNNIWLFSFLWQNKNLHQLFSLSTLDGTLSFVCSFLFFLHFKHTAVSPWQRHVTRSIGQRKATYVRSPLATFVRSMDVFFFSS